MVTASSPDGRSVASVQAAPSGVPARRLLGASARAFTILVAGAAVGLGAQLGTVRLIGAEGFGIYAYVIAWTTLLGYVSTLGFHVSLLKLLPALQVKKEWAQARALLRFAFSAGALAGVFVGLGALAVFAVTYGNDSETGRALMLGAAVVPLMAMRLIGAAGVRAFGGIVTAMISERILRDLFALMLLAGLLASGIAPANAVSAVLSMLVAAGIVLLVVLGFLAASRPAGFVAAVPGRSSRDWLRPVIPLTAIMFADTLLSRSGVLVIGFFGNPVDAGVFAVSFSLGLIAAMPRMAVAVLFAPTVSRLYTQRDRDGLQVLHRRSTIMTLLGTLSISIPLLASAPILLNWFGDDFGAAQPVLAVLLLGQLAAAAGGPQQHLLTMTGHEKQGAVLMAAASAAAIGLGAAFYGAFGIIGAAAAYATSMAAWNIGMAIFLVRHLDIRPGLAWPRRRETATIEGE